MEGFRRAILNEVKCFKGQINRIMECKHLYNAKGEIEENSFDDIAYYVTVRRSDNRLDLKIAPEEATVEEVLLVLCKVLDNIEYKESINHGENKIFSATYNDLDVYVDIDLKNNVNCERVQVGVTEMKVPKYEIKCK